MQADCTFCQIVSGELPADLVDEDERTVAFMDLSPATLGHVLVVPRRHVSDVMSAEAEDWLAVAATARRMARWVVGAFRAGGVDLVQANSDGSVGNQTVFHLHVHVLPRYHDDRLGAWWSPETADPSEITEAARRLVDHGRQDPTTAQPAGDRGPALTRALALSARRSAPVLPAGPSFEVCVPTWTG